MAAMKMILYNKGVHEKGEISLTAHYYYSFLASSFLHEKPLWAARLLHIRCILLLPAVNLSKKPLINDVRHDGVWGWSKSR